MTLDNPAYQYAMTQEATEPDIFFDESESNERRLSDTPLGARIVVSQLIEASSGNTTKLQSLMCIFSGLSLREAAKHCDTSHEYVRIQVESIKDDFPALYSVLTDRDRFTVTSIIPIGKNKRWKITNLETKKTSYFDNLFRWCQKNGMSYSKIRHAMRCKDGFFRNLKIERQR